MSLVSYTSGFGSALFQLGLRPATSQNLKKRLHATSTSTQLVSNTSANPKSNNKRTMSPREEHLGPLSSADELSIGDLSSEEAVDCRKEAKTVIKGQKTVSFGVVEIREYNLVVGDHPDVMVGPPVSLGWDFATRAAVSIAAFEQNRPLRRHDLRMSGSMRKTLLIDEFLIEEEEVRSAMKEVQRIRSQRISTKQEGTLKSYKAVSKMHKLRRFSKKLLQSLAESAKYMAPPMIS